MYLHVVFLVCVLEVPLLRLRQFALQALLRSRASKLSTRVSPMAWPVVLDGVALRFGRWGTNLHHLFQKLIYGVLILRQFLLQYRHAEGCVDPKKQLVCPPNHFLFGQSEQFGRAHEQMKMPGHADVPSSVNASPAPDVICDSVLE